MFDLSWPQGKVKGESGHRWSETANRDRLFPVWQQDRGDMKPKCVDLQKILNVPSLQFEWPSSFNTSHHSILLRCNLFYTDVISLNCPVTCQHKNSPDHLQTVALALIRGVNFVVWNSILDEKHTCRKTCGGSNVLTTPCSCFQVVVHFMSWGWG